MHTTQNRSPITWLDTPLLTTLRLNWETVAFITILLLAVFTRFYDLESRVMSHDENSHVYYAWRLSRGEGYQHTPLTHGPLQFHLIALSYFIFGDNDFTARIPAALTSILAIAFLWNYRRYLGRIGTIVTAGLMLISPYMLYYGRYVRNEVYAVLFGLIAMWAVLRYLESGASRYLYWLTAATMLHFTAKETAFIYTAQILLFLGLLFVSRLTQTEWPKPNYQRLFLGALVVAFLLLALGIASGMVIQDPNTGDVNQTDDSGITTITGPNLLALILYGIAGFAGMATLFFVIRGYSWERLRKNRAFSMILVLFTLVLPQLAPLPVRLLGWDPTDYSFEGMLRTATVLVPLAVISIVAGYLWNPKLWLINAAIFYVPFTILYTTIFTNGAGFFTGLVGSLGYWLEQQGVERGNQPLYYYIFIQIPFYEFLPALGSILAIYLGFQQRELITPARDNPETHPDTETETKNQSLPLIFFIFWILTSIIAYTIAGEKMPWLTVHIALPLILTAGYGIGQLTERVHWGNFIRQNGFLIIILLAIFFLSLMKSVGLLLGPTPPFQGKELSQLSSTTTFITSLIITVGSGWGLSIVLKRWDFNDFWRITTLLVFALLALQTLRTSFRAAYINYDNAKEYLVYAHSGRGPKTALDQIRELSMRITGDLAIQVAFDDQTTYPYWWYLRNYPNQKYYGKNPTRELRDAPVILVGENNYDKIEPVVGQAYNHFDYIRIWWPNQDYFSLTWSSIKAERNTELARQGITDIPPMSLWEYIQRVWGHILPFFTDPQVREAVWEIWYNRDYSKYAELKGRDMSLPNWQPSNRMRLYVRKDVGAKVWNLGAVSVLPEEVIADPYEGKEIDLMADQILGTNGSEAGQFQLPRDIAISDDGTLYVADTNNHRIQHITTDGEVLHVWGTFADSAAGDAPGGTFYEPWGIAVGPDGNIFVADTWNHRVQKFSPTGDFIQQWGYFGQAEDGFALWGPRDILIDEEGRIYLTDTGNKRIVIYDADGNYLSEFGDAGLLAGQLDEPVGLAVDQEGRIYVADTWNQRVQVFEPDESGLNFQAVKEWEIVGWYGQSLDNKPYLAVGENENIFVSDPEGYRILEFNQDGEFVRYWGDFGSGVNQFNLPTGLAVEQDGDLWVADAGNHRILHFSLP